MSATNDTLEHKPARPIGDLQHDLLKHGTLKLIVIDKASHRSIDCINFEAKSFVHSVNYSFIRIQGHAIRLCYSRFMEFAEHGATISSDDKYWFIMLSERGLNHAFNLVLQYVNA